MVDESGNGRVLTAQGSASGYTLADAGPIDKSTYWHNAIDTYAITTQKFGYRYATLEAWVFLTINPTAVTSIIGMANAGPGATTQYDKNFYVRTDRKLAFYVNNGAGVATTLVTPAALNINQWHYVVASVGAAGLKIYVDGVVVASNAGVKTSYVQLQRVMTRAGASPYNGRAGMKIAEPAVYYQQLLDSRIASHYDAASAVL